MSWLILGKKPKARAAFEELLAIDPHYTLSDPSHSPKLREFFEERAQPASCPATARAKAKPSSSTRRRPAPPPGAPLEMQVVVIRGAPLVQDGDAARAAPGPARVRDAPMRGDADRWQLSYSPPRDVRRLHARILRRGARRQRARGRARGLAGAADPAARARRADVSGRRPGSSAGTYGPPSARWWPAAAIGGAVAGTAEKAPKGSLPPGSVSLGLRF